MPAKEIKELRQAGKLAEAYAMAKAELDFDINNIWGKRNLSWVLYAQLDEVATNLDAFLDKIIEVKELDLPESEEMFFENLMIPISKAARSITNEASIDINKMHRLLDSIKDLSFKRDSKWFSVLFSAMHKGMKESNRYIEFADWWNFGNFRPEDFQKETTPAGKEIMALAEQAYIAYAKHLLPKQTPFGEIIFNKEKAEKFLPDLSKVAENYPLLQYPSFYQAKLLLALGDKDNMLKAFLPFAKKKQNEFWVWDVFAEAFSNDPDKVFACYCKALSCKSPEEMLVNLRERMAKCFLDRNLYAEAKTEIHLLSKSKEEHSFKSSNRVIQWQSQEWYKNNEVKTSNRDFYSQYKLVAEDLLFSDVKEDTIFIEYVNVERNIANFILNDNVFGFFKYDRFFNKLEVGDILKVRISAEKRGEMYKFFTAVKVENEIFKLNYMKNVQGKIRIPEGKLFGFLDDVYVHQSILKKHNLVDGVNYNGTAIKTYNKEKMKWSWKLL